MRYHHLRFDIWICLLLGFVISMGTGKIAENLAKKNYNSYVADHTVEDGNIGGIADENFFRAQNVEDLLSHETFTIISPGIEYRNKGGGYHNNHYLQAVTLPSGEKIAALINEDYNVQESLSIVGILFYLLDVLFMKIYQKILTLSIKLNIKNH